MKFFSRSERRAAKRVGVIQIDPLAKAKRFRDPKLETLDSYYENRQYEGLYEWDIDEGPNGEIITPRQKKPRLRLAFAKSLTQRLGAKLVGQSVFPSFNIEESPEDQEFFKAVVRETKLKAFIQEPIRRMLNSGATFVRFHIVSGTVKLERFDSKVCYPTFQANGDLEAMTVKYTYTDPEDRDSKGSPKIKWFRMDLLTDREIMYDNPEFNENSEPVFQVVEEVVHDLGFVQGQWLRTSEDHIDGFSITEDLTDFIDELNYSLSQSSTSVGYNQEPQLTFTGMTHEETEEVVRSATKSWNLGREGKAGFVESTLNGVTKAIELRDKIRLNIQDISRVILLDPEKIVGSAQSAKAMEVLHGPLKDLVDELREPIGGQLKSLVLKMGVAILIANERGMPVPIQIPQGYAPKSFAIELDWPPIFQQTMEDLLKKVQVASAAATANFISRKTATRFVAKDFGIEDVEAEAAEIAAQPVLNPFGGF